MGNQILASDKQLKINDFPLLGMVQSFDWSPAFNAQDIFELGNSSKVASALELETSGSFELMSIGGTAGLLARMITRRTAGVFNGYEFDRILVATQLATSGTTTTITKTAAGWTVDVYLGKSVYITVGTNVGLRRTITTNSATVLTVSPAFPTAIDATSSFQIDGGPNAFVWTQDNLSECSFDIVSYIKSDQTNWDKTITLPRCFLTSMSGRAEANGSATESFNFTGDFVMGTVYPYHYIRSIPAPYTSVSTCTLADPTVATATWALAYLYINERRLRTTVGDGIYAALGASGVITITGMTILNTDKIQAIVWDNSSPPQVFPTITAADRATTSFFVRGYSCDIYVAPATPATPTTLERWLKVQSIDWNIDLRTEALRQVSYNSAGTSIYCRLPTFPINITANVSAYESDWADWKAVSDGAVKTFGTGGAAVYADSYDFSPNSLKTSFAVVVQYKNKLGVVMQTWNFSDMRLEGSGSRINVGGRSEISWSLSGTTFTLTGLNSI